jgi:DNA-binding CsgD family transcriptional regulator
VLKHTVVPVEALIADIYETAVDPRRWPAFLEKLRQLLDSEFVSIISVHKMTLQVTHVYHTRWDESAVKELATRQFVRMPNRAQVLFGPLDTPVSCLSLMSENEFGHLAIQQDWMAPNGLRDLATCALIDTAERHTVLAFVTSREREPITPEELQAVQRLSPHMRRVLLLNNKLENFRWEARLAMAALSQIDTPILICEANGKLVLGNQAGKAALASEEALFIKSGLIKASLPTLQPDLSEALSRATTSGQPSSKRGVSLALTDRVGGTYAYVLPMHGYGARSIPPLPLAAVFLSNNKGHALPEEAVLVTLFNLTPTEAKIMARVGRGQSGPTIRDAFGISANTVKMHLSRIFRKTGCATQAELVKLMNELSLPLEVPHHGPPLG